MPLKKEPKHNTTKTQYFQENKSGNLIIRFTAVTCEILIPTQFQPLFMINPTQPDCQLLCLWKFFSNKLPADNIKNMTKQNCLHKLPETVTLFK